ncbi:hypothetical protein FRC09_009125 [Ceratobasidium sp. 395]|nr:hypothetical protein FRC09_009125 [Ceratobasidium sp. 395]
MFGFNILQHNVVALKGEAARKVFFDRKDLSFTEGYEPYRLLFGGGPDLKDVVPDVKDKNDQEQSSWVLKRLTPLLRMERVAQLTPLFMSDLERNLVKWGDSGQFDPFEDMYTVVFQLTIRAGGCREIADSVEQCKRMEDLFWAIDEGATPTAVLFPWIPSAARRKKVKATGDVFDWFDHIIKTRRQEERREDDALQMLLDLGYSTTDVIEFVLFTLFAGIINTGLMSAWLFIFLDQEPEWRDKVVLELRVMLDKYAPILDDHVTTVERLLNVPPHAWENELPILDDCIRETIRRILSTAMLRRVVNGETEIAGKTIPDGTFLVYSAGEVHNDPSIYPDPATFNPGRYADGQDKSQTYGFLGWGVGRHPCLGRRFAQYEIKVICGVFLTVYEYEVANSKGKRPDPSFTVPDRNNMHQARPKDETFYLKYKKRYPKI